MQHSDIFSFNGITNKEKIEKDIDQNKDKDKAQDIIYEEIDSLNIPKVKQVVLAQHFLL